ncbi:MAG: secondary thiamine-phosphate synthase enzyme YjbQ [Prevotellaceae bacterium]|jgi:secondary thiamine-phosphate synthase enzyme|nr:secondary thiamine-phosphate synthase enzyme YjbQ [Prevotellaceae bacterium]
MTTTIDIQLPYYKRGFHLITRDVTGQLPPLPANGILTLFIRHTSAAITLNENADPDVRQDFASFFDRLVPDGAPYFIHTLEGTDDMSAHIKASLIGSSVTIPIKNHRLHLGTWQGIYLCEFRDSGDRRRLSATVMGE